MLGSTQVEKSKQWYQDVFGVEANEMGAFTFGNTGIFIEEHSDISANSAAEPARVIINFDVADEAATKAYVAATLARFGRLDVLFSNAGNFGTVAPIEDYPTETFDAVLAVHVRGAFLAAKHAVPHLQRGASIIITSSVAGLRGDPGVYGYITAKHAQTGLMRVLAKELAPRGIRVNTVNPGPIGNAFQKRVEEDLTGILGRDGTEFFDEIIPMGRHGTPEEIARTVLYLASDLSTFTTGAVLPVDGGMSV